MTRFASILLLIASPAFAQVGTHTTRNFHVVAPNDEMARVYGQAAEQYRKAKAKEWLDKEMPDWSEKCRLDVTIKNGFGPSGATHFIFDPDVRQRMEIDGPHERLLASVLPHEITHTVFANHFRKPVPRWADEGGAVFSEDAIEIKRHDRMARDLLADGRAMRLSHLFKLTEYPQDVACVYAQGMSVVKYLVDRSSRGKFLEFVGDGMRGDWDGAVKTHYGFDNVSALEAAWINSLRGVAKDKPTSSLSARLVTDALELRGLRLPGTTAIK